MEAGILKHLKVQVVIIVGNKGTMAITSSITKLDVAKNEIYQVMRAIEETQSCKNNTIADMLAEGL